MYEGMLSDVSNCDEYAAYDAANTFMNCYFRNLSVIMASIQPTSAPTSTFVVTKLYNRNRELSWPSWNKRVKSRGMLVKLTRTLLMQHCSKQNETASLMITVQKLLRSNFLCH
jgi:hypothetical protein